MFPEEEGLHYPRILTSICLRHLLAIMVAWIMTEQGFLVQLLLLCRVLLGP